MAEMQECSKCGIGKEITSFHRRGNGYRKDCKDCVAEKTKAHRLKNSELIKSKKKKYWEENKHRFSESRSEYYNEYKTTEKRRESARNWARRNRIKHIEYHRHRYNTDPQFNLAIKVRRRIHMALRRIKSGRKDKIIDLLGCTYSFFKEYIEHKFIDGMNWEMVFNGSIHIDHIKPCSAFDLTDFENQKICFHYTNLQPLWAIDNMIKHNKAA